MDTRLQPFQAAARLWLPDPSCLSLPPHWPASSRSVSLSFPDVPPAPGPFPAPQRPPETSTGRLGQPPPAAGGRTFTLIRGDTRAESSRCIRNLKPAQEPVPPDKSTWRKRTFQRAGLQELMLWKALMWMPRLLLPVRPGTGGESWGQRLGRPAARGPPESHSSECRAHVGVNRPGSAGRLSR